MKSRTLMATLVVLGCASRAAAEPSVWARAANPTAAADADTLAELHRQYGPYLDQGDEPGHAVASTINLHKAKTLLEQAHAETSQSPEMRYALSRVERRLYDRDGDARRLARAAALLRWTADHAPSTGLKSTALYELALCDARLGQRDAEVAAYEEALTIQPSSIDRSMLLANQAEGLMSRGDLAAAVRGYREALGLLPGVAMSAYGVTTLWGLAVALDRSGDQPRALDHIALARSYDPRDAKLHGPNWFFMPPYDEHWYAALGHLARARDARDPELRRQAERHVLDSWHAYLDAAPADDPWLALGEQRLRQAERAVRGKR